MSCQGLLAPFSNMQNGNVAEKIPRGWGNSARSCSHSFVWYHTCSLLRSLLSTKHAVHAAIRSGGAARGTDTLSQTQESCWCHSSGRVVINRCIYSFRTTYGPCVGLFRIRDSCTEGETASSWDRVVDKMTA